MPHPVSGHAPAQSRQPSPLSRPGLALLTGLGLALCLGCGSQDEASEATDEEITRVRLPVEIMVAAPGRISRQIEAQARLQSSRRQELVTLAAGIVDSAPVTSGQVVNKGEVLLTLAPLPDQHDQLTTAEIGLRRAKRALQRLQSLQQEISGAVAQNELDAAQDAVDDAQMALEQAQRDQRNRTIIAPFNGVIDGMSELIPGQRLDAGAVIGRLQQIDSYTTAIAIPETLLPALRKDLEVDVQPLVEDGASGRIIALPAAIDRETGTGQVRVRVDDPPPSWRPGAYAIFRIHTEAIPGAVILPRSAIQHRRNRPYVWQVFASAEDETSAIVRQTWLSLGTGDEDQVIISEGLQAGDLVVTDGTAGLADEVPVLIQNPPPDLLLPPLPTPEETAEATSTPGQQR